MTAPWPPPTFVGGALVVLALLMFGANYFVVTRLFPGRGARPHLGDVVLISGLLLTAICLWLSLVYAATSPTEGAWIAVFLAVNSMMVAVGAWFLAVMLRAEQRFVSRSGWSWPTAFTALVLGNELSMAAAFVLITTGPDPYLGVAGSGAVGLVTDATTSVWFFWPMLATMLVLIATVPLPGAERTALLGLTATAALGPWIVASPLAGALAMSGLMAIVFLLLFREIARESSDGYLAVARGVIAAFAAMAAAEAAFFVDPSAGWAPVPFAAATLVVMGAELLFLSRRALAALADPAPSADATAPPMPTSGTRSESPTTG